MKKMCICITVACVGLLTASMAVGQTQGTGVVNLTAAGTSCFAVPPQCVQALPRARRSGRG